MTDTARQAIMQALGTWSFTADEKAKPQEAAEEMMAEFDRAWPGETFAFTADDLAEYITERGD